MKKGLDLCYHQGTVDWKKVKSSGIDFIIPRDGWGTNDLDPKLIQNVKEAQEAGISVPGVYHFIYAVNVKEAIQNAACAINNARRAGLPSSTVIWCDQEEDTVIAAKKKGYNITTKMQTEITKAFCDYILEQGYCTGVYLNQDYITRVYGKDIINQYDIWLADLEGEPYCDCVYRQYDWHGKINGIGSEVDLDAYYGKYTAGTARPKSSKEEGDTMGKPKSKEYVKVALEVLDRSEGLNYVNSFPKNCGYCEPDLTLDGDCWNINPKATTWSLFLKDPISKNRTPGKYYYEDGIKASGLPDVTGDEIMNNYCTETTFRKMLQAGVAPCLVLINGNHMGAYLGEFVRDGRTYNISEFSPNGKLEGKMRSYVDEYGRRLPYKGYKGDPIGTWNRCGYLTAFLDYSDWSDPEAKPEPDSTPKTEPTQEISDLTLALKIYKGDYGVNPNRRTEVTKKYGAEKYVAAQKVVDKIVSYMNWCRIEINLADEILNKKWIWGNNPNRQEKITLKYGANAYRIAQGFVNSIDHGDYTVTDLWTAYDVADGILREEYGNDPERKQKIISEYGETVRDLAQQIVNYLYVFLGY